MLIETIITMALAVLAPGDRGGSHFFCCESTDADEQGRDTGHGCKLISESDAKRCKAEVLECPGGVTSSHGFVTCLESQWPRD